MKDRGTTRLRIQAGDMIPTRSSNGDTKTSVQRTNCVQYLQPSTDRPDFQCVLSVSFGLKLLLCFAEQTLLVLVSPIMLGLVPVSIIFPTLFGCHV